MPWSEENRPDPDEIPESAIADRSLTGHLIDIRHFQPGTYRIAQLRLVACPLDDCEHEVKNWFNSRSSIQDHLLHDHKPEDFGLSPLRNTQDPETVVISTGRMSDTYHTRNCGSITRADDDNLIEVERDNLADKYSWCQHCKGRQINIEEIKT
jgi:hypothetical protein